MFRKKSIVLSDTEDNSNKKGVLTLQETELGLEGSLRLYNFPTELSGISSMGFYVDKKVYKAGLTYKSSRLYEFFVNTKEIPEKFSCAVVNFQNAVATPILYGSSEGSEDEIYASIIAEIAQNNSVDNVKKTLDDYGVDFEEKDQKQIDKEIDKALCQPCEACENCVYKKYFYENQQIEATAEKKESESVLEEKETLPKKKDEGAEVIFLDKLKPQIDKLFEKNPIEDNLQKLIPSSKWVKVDYEDDGDFYVFGLLYDEAENVRYVCYGVPAIFEESPPKELAGYPIWLPLDKENREGFGYWLTYQDATTGEPVKAIID